MRKIVTKIGRFSFCIPASTDDLFNMTEYFKKHCPEDDMRVFGWGPYGITKDGRVYSFIRGKWLKPAINSVGYLQLFLIDYSLPQGSVRRWYRIHRLVAEAFVVNKRVGVAIEVDHKDGNKQNNHYKNLRWVTHQENIRHTFKLGRKVKVGIENHLYGRTHSEEAKAKMSVAKMGSSHPKYRGKYVYGELRGDSLRELAEKMNTYTQKAYRLFKKGEVTLEKSL